MKKFFGLLFLFLLAFAFVGCDKTPKEVKLEVNDADKTIELVVGEKKTITPEVTDGFELVWSSSKSDVATVDKGTISAVAEGKADITVQIKDREESVTIKVTVILPLPTEVTITGDEDIIIGSSITLTATVKPNNANQTVSWTSSDDSVALVNPEGKVTALSEGEVTITAISVLESVKASVKITVVLPAPTSITITGSKEVNAGAEIQLKAVVSPVLASQKVKWSVDKPELATINEDGILVAIAAGQVTIIAKSEVDETIAAEYKVTIIKLEPTSVTITGPNEILLGKDPTYKYTASVLPAGVDQKVNWTVNNPNLATIDQNGVLTPLAVGTVVVKATSIDETIYFEMTVSIDEFLPTNITISGNNKVILGIASQYSAVVLPEGIGQAVTWSVDNSTLATIDENGLLTTLAEGKVIVTATSKLLNTITATIEVEIIEAQEAAALMAIAEGYTPYYPGGDVLSFLELHGFSGYTLEFGNKQMLFYGEKAVISLRAMEAGETVLPWQAVQPYTTGDTPLVNFGVRKEGAVSAHTNELTAPTGVVYLNENTTDVVVKSKELYGYQNDSAWGHGMYGVILVDGDGKIITNISSADLAAGINITIPAGGSVITMFQGERQIIAGIGSTTSEERGKYSFGQNPHFAVGQTVKIKFHE